MKTLNEIKSTYDQLMLSIDQELSKIQQSEDDLVQLEDLVFNDTTDDNVSKYVLYIEQIKYHATLVRNAIFYAKEVGLLLKEITEKMKFIRSVAHQFANHRRINAALVDLAISCESLEGELYGCGGQLNEKMLQFTSLCLQDEDFYRSFELMPWIGRIYIYFVYHGLDTIKVQKVIL